MLVLARSLFVVAALATATATALSAQQNTLVLIADDLGLDAVACYGLGLRSVPTPNIDALAASGVRFTRAYMNPACSPTRGCVMTGRFGFRNGVPTTVAPTDPGLDVDEVQLPAALQGSGYDTALIGKWHLGTRHGNATPTQAGWQHFAGVLGSGVGDYYSWPKVTNGVAGWSSHYVTSAQVDDALAWIATRTAPWLLTIAFCAPHSPYQAPPPHLHTRDLGSSDPAIAMRARFEATVEALDTEIGRLLAQMSPAVRANTNILLFGDNGTDGAVAVAPFRPDRMKGSLYEPGIRVPLLVHGPAVTAPGRICHALVSAVDIFATVLDLCGVAPPTSPAGPLDGTSMRPLLTDTAPAIRNWVYADMQFSSSGGGYVVVDETHALVRVQWVSPQRQELYRVDLDPLATTNLLSAPLNPLDDAAYRRLLSVLATIRTDGWVENVGHGCAPAVGPTPSLRSQTMPRVATSYVLCVEGIAPTATGVWFAGGRTNHTRAPFGAPPIALDPWGMPGCTAFTFDDLCWVRVANPAPTGGYVHVPIPFVPALAGLDCLLQAYVEDPTANAIGLLPTNAQHITLGLPW